MLYFLTSGRLGFRYWTQDDLSLAIGLWGVPEVTALTGGPLTPEEIRARLTTEIEQKKEHGVQYWPFFLLESGQHVGCCGLRTYRPEQNIYEFGIHLRPDFWGKGLATEAALTVIRYAFDKLNADALFAGHHPDNVASRQLLSKLGFVYTHDCFYAPTGLMHPSYLIRREQSPIAQPAAGPPK
jgi:[ribosomal protein S5]-alanine N-acetyltransferase